MKSAIVARLDLRCGLGWCLKLHKGRLKKITGFQTISVLIFIVIM